jgi:hypothetical protein
MGIRSSRLWMKSSRQVFKRLYVQYVRLHLEFASAAWSPWHEADKTVLEKIQQRAVSMNSGLKGATLCEKLAELGPTTLEEHRHQTDMFQTLKILRGIDRVSSDTWFQRVDTSVRTTQERSGSTEPETPASPPGYQKKFFSNRVIEP